jgi:hypothetical protein
MFGAPFPLENTFVRPNDHSNLFFKVTANPPSSIHWTIFTTFGLFFRPSGISKLAFLVRISFTKGRFEG